MRFKKRSGIEQQRIVVLLVGLLVILAFYGVTAHPQPTGPTTSTTTTSSQTTSSTLTSTVGTSSGPNNGAFGSHTGVIIPFYLGPASPGFQSNLQTILAAKTAFMSVPMIVIINPDNGVGVYSATMLSAVQQMQAENIFVFGYVWTNYGCVGYPPFPQGSTCTSYAGSGGPFVTMAFLQNNMSDYSTWYHVQGTFFDGMANTPNSGFESFYSSLTAYARNQGQSYTVGNPGTDVPSDYIGTVTSMVVYEGATLPDVTCSTAANPPPCLAQAWHVQYGKYNFALIGFDQPQLSASYVQQASQYIGWMYITDNTGCPGNGFYNLNAPSDPCGAGVPVNPYNTLPSYLTAEMAAIASSP